MFNMKNCQHCGKPFNPPCNSSVRCSTECNFWSKVDRRGDNDCWLWTASKQYRGYGQFSLPTGRNICASRFSWILHNGDIPDDIFVLHNCPTGDNPSCVNPRHLWLGNQQDNINDMDKKGRRNPAFGERNCRAIINSDIVKSIRSQYAKGSESYSTLAAVFGLTRKHVGKIVTRKLWPHVH